MVWLRRWISSKKPDPKIPAGKAKIPIPNIATIPASARPQPVTGNTSPYPTVVNVTILHHIASGMLENWSGWALFSAKYINDDAISSKKPKTSTTVPSSPLLARTTRPRVWIPEKCLPNLVKRANRRNVRRNRRSMTSAVPKMSK